MSNLSPSRWTARSARMLTTLHVGRAVLNHDHGGWPTSVCLTPDRKPFYGGTYFPPEGRMGLPQFQPGTHRNCASLEKSKAERHFGGQRKNSFRPSLKSIVNPFAPNHRPGTVLESHQIDSAHRSRWTNVSSSEFGGFGDAPKFFHAMDLRLSLRHWKRTKSAEIAIAPNNIHFG